MGTVQTKLFEYSSEEMNHLMKADPVLGEAMARIGKIERVVMPDLFAALLYAIVGQRISVKAAHTIWERIQERFGEITPGNLAAQTIEDIQRCGMTRKQAEALHAIAQVIACGTFSLDELKEMPDEEAIERLTALKGIGRWTGEMVLIHSLERRDVVSWGDIAIRRGMMRLYGLPSLTREQFDEYRCRYSPCGSLASLYLWAISAE
ncbi:DNA-3-methyladenine glycosylase 2 family protein [Gorillibacterium sp. CAU 1737]|uniref:DNA-3-methyladenine glycosylase family protein n=1 Tax=Gorillibacterium sp. CAU 1737 TaxID=3140362 RepID=UPI0032617442